MYFLWPLVTLLIIAFWTIQWSHGSSRVFAKKWWSILNLNYDKTQLMIEKSRFSLGPFVKIEFLWDYLWRFRRFSFYWTCWVAQCLRTRTGGPSRNCMKKLPLAFEIRKTSSLAEFFTSDWFKKCGSDCPQQVLIWLLTTHSVCEVAKLVYFVAFLWIGLIWSFRFNKISTHVFNWEKIFQTFGRNMYIQFWINSKFVLSRVSIEWSFWSI